MSDPTDCIDIKLEGNDLQNYLEKFDGEIDGNVVDPIIGGGVNASGTASDDAEEDDDDDTGTYFVDQTGNYYFQANKDSEPVLTDPPDEMQHEYLDEDAEQNETAKNTEDTQTMDVSSVADDQEDVRYVFVIDDEKGTEEKVYDFEDDDKTIEAGSGDEVPHTSTKPKITKISKRSNVTHSCNYCTYTSSKRYLLSRHMKSHSEERPFKCSVCERGFKTLASLNNHVNTHTGVKPHRCKFCDSAFTTSGELVRHVRYRHTHEKPHKCTECDYASVELSKLKRHIRCHTGERPYQCPHCTYASPDTFKLKRHLRIHTGEKPYECDVCHARFTQSNSLKAHKLIHSVGDKPVFECELCPTTCGRKTDLRIHVQKLHTSDKPIKCKRCGNLYPDRYTYKIHSKTHEGEKCYKCDLCPYASISARHLESHILIHTDSKPFQCDQCEQAFRQKQLLKRHVNLYHNPTYIPPKPKEKTHVCPNNCKRAFRHKGNLIRHMAMHDPESNIREEAMALKMGRQKRIQIINGQPVEFYPDENTGDEEEEEEEEEDEDEQPEEDEHKFGLGMDNKSNDGQTLVELKSAGSTGMMALEGDDGQQYVVVEIIQSNENKELNETEISVDPIAIGDDFILSEEIDQAMIDTLQTNKKLRVEPDKMLTDDQDRTNCFGFDDEDDDDRDCKSTIQLFEFAEV